MTRGAVLLWMLLILASPIRAKAESPTVTSHIPRDRIESTAIISVGYSKRRHILEIQFANGAVYRYLEVAPSVYRDLIATESKTRYYDANIKGNYRSMRVRPRVKDQPTN
jgi:hypothetical protein